MNQIAAAAIEYSQICEVAATDFALEFVDDGAYEFVSGGTAVNSY